MPFKNTKLTLKLPTYPLIYQESLCFFSFSLSGEDESNGRALLLPPLLLQLSCERNRKQQDVRCWLALNTTAMVDISHQHTRVRVNRNWSIISSSLSSCLILLDLERWSDLLLLCQGLLTHLLCLPATGVAGLQSEHAWDMIQVYSISHIHIKQLRASKTWKATAAWSLLLWGPLLLECGAQKIYSFSTITTDLKVDVPVMFYCEVYIVQLLESVLNASRWSYMSMLVCLSCTGGKVIT